MSSEPQIWVKSPRDLFMHSLKLPAIPSLAEFLRYSTLGNYLTKLSKFASGDGSSITAIGTSTGKYLTADSKVCRRYGLLPKAGIITCNKGWFIFLVMLLSHI